MNDQKLWDYIDGLLDLDDVLEVEQFLNANSEARLKVEEFKKLNTLLSQHNLIHTRPDFAQTVVNQIQSKSTGNLSIRKLLPFWVGFIVINLLAIVITKGEGLLPSAGFIDLSTINQWLPYLNPIGMIGAGITLLYFLDKFFAHRTSRAS